MTTASTYQPLTHSLSTLFTELTHGPQVGAAYVLNDGDAGLLRSLDGITAAEASLIPIGHSSSVAAHVEHVRYGLSLLNRWSDGENPFGQADWSAAWRTPQVSTLEWDRLREALRIEVAAWLATLQQRPRSLDDQSITGMVASVVHLGYHMGAVRQLVPTLAGPPA